MGIIGKEWVVITRQHRVIRYAQKNMQSVCIKKWEVTGMNNYLVIKDAVEQFEITQYALRKAIKNGQVRHFVTNTTCTAVPCTTTNPKERCAGNNAESKYMFTGRTAKISFPKKYIM